MAQAFRGRSILDLIDRLTQVICVVLASVIVLSVVGQVLARYITSDSTPWAAELATYSFVWLTMLSIALGVRRGRHMALDVWEYVPTPRWVDRMLEAVVALIIIGVLAVLAWYGVGALPAAANRLSPGLGIPFSFVSAAVPVGCGLSIIFQIELYVREVSSDRGRRAKAMLGRTLWDTAPVPTSANGDDL